MKKIMILLFVLMVSCNKNTSSENSENFLLKPKAFQEKFTSSPGGVLLDVRTLEEVRQEHLKGAVNFDFTLPQFNILIAGLDKSKPYFVYCASGVRSAKAADKMRDLDFPRVYLLEGGLKAWKAEGLPTQSAKGANP